MTWWAAAFSVGLVLLRGSIAAVALSPLAAGSVVAQTQPELSDLLSESLPFDRPWDQPTQAGPRKIKKIIGGEDAKPGEFKWQVALIRSDGPQDTPFSGFFCGASLIASTWVLTAAHCTFRRNPAGRNAPIALGPGDIDVYLGSHDFVGGERIPVKEVLRHDYDRRTKDNDLALLRLARPAQDSAKIAFLPQAAKDRWEALASNRRLTVLGWGATERGEMSAEERRSVQTLQVARNITVQDTRDCNSFYLRYVRTKTAGILKSEGKSDSEIRALLDKWYPESFQIITENMFCAGRVGGFEDSCFGDSGGPLIDPRDGIAQVGTVSWGPQDGCGLTNLWGVYVKLARYADWIQSKLQAAPGGGP